MRHFRRKHLQLGKLQAAGLNFIRPHMSLGDIVVFTNFTIHATYVDERMTHPRTGIEGRMPIEAASGSFPPAP
jgi:hypothetical protein